MALSREERWNSLYERLLDALSSFGKNDAFGEGDYWVVDDDWGGQHQKLCITSPRFWSDSVRDQIRQTLADSFADWGVYVVFEDQSARPGFIVYADGIDKNPRWS